MTLRNFSAELKKPEIPGFNISDYIFIVILFTAAVKLITLGKCKIIDRIQDSFRIRNGTLGLRSDADYDKLMTSDADLI